MSFTLSTCLQSCSHDQLRLFTLHFCRLSCDDELESLEGTDLSFLSLLSLGFMRIDVQLTGFVCFRGLVLVVPLKGRGLVMSHTAHPAAGDESPRLSLTSRMPALIVSLKRANCRALWATEGRGKAFCCCDEWQGLQEHRWWWDITLYDESKVGRVFYKRGERVMAGMHTVLQ